MKNNVLEAIEYRKLIAEDSKKYRDIRLESLQKYPSHFGSIYAEQKQKLKLAFEVFIETSSPHFFVMGALHLNELIGICAFALHKEERYQHRGEIIQMYVQPKYQGHKIGFNLLNATAKKAFEIEMIEQLELEVLSSITSANKIYEKIGFKEHGLHKRFNKVAGVYADKRLMILPRPKES